MILKIVRRPPLLPVRLVQSENAGGLNLHLLRKYIDLLFYFRITLNQRNNIDNCHISNAEKDTEKCHRLRKIPLVSTNQE